MKYFVFEAGGRTGLSAEFFFMHRCIKDSGDSLIMADMDKTLMEVPASGGVIRIGEDRALEMLQESMQDCTVFPSDELARQGKPLAYELSKSNPLVAVEPWFYDKHQVNVNLAKACAGCRIRIPLTFELKDSFMRPNTMSAGSRGVGRLENTCITEYIEIAREFVVDVNWVAAEPVIYAREVKIKNGYDRLLRFLPADSKVVKAVDEFVRAMRTAYPGMATGIFHIQIMENPEGRLYFVEYSKRISGTSLVNILRGYNPFDAFAGVETPGLVGEAVQENVWYRYEDLLLKLKYIRG